MFNKLNKKGWIAIVEVCIAIIVLFAFLLLTFNQQTKKETNIFMDLNKAILFQTEENETFRNFVLTGNSSEIEQNLRSFLKKFDAKVNLTACTTDMVGSCPPLNVPSGKDIVSYDIFVAGNNTIYEPKKLRVFVWEA